MNSAPFPGRPFSLQTDAELVGQEIQYNRSRFYGWARIHKDAYSPTWSNNPISDWEVLSNVSLARGDNLTYDFRNGTDFYLYQNYFYINHNVDGTLPAVSFRANADYDQLGFATVQTPLSAPRIPRGPRVNDYGTWRNTVAYVNDNGVWKIAIPYVNDNGVWKVAGG